jgi:HTH-type transcriptional regulator/antitoxin HigA
MEIKPIHTEMDYQAALHEIEKLMDSNLGTPEGDRLDILVTLIQSYEEKNFPIPEPDDPVEVLKYFMESRGLDRSDLIPYLGSKERVSEVLNYKRTLSLAMIRRLHQELGIPSDLLLGVKKPRKNSILNTYENHGNQNTTHIHQAQIRDNSSTKKDYGTRRE